ncbi:MAG: matrixin family metalloprotease [Bryobacteraceae bacterium]
MRTWKRILTLAIGLAAMSSFASAYYFWIFLGTGTGSTLALPGRFDLNALPHNTLSYFISNQAPVGLVADDTQAAVYSQIRSAAEVWSGVGTSALRLHFGGISDTTLAQATPGIDVVFDDDMPPGILAQSKPTFPADLSLLSAKETTFVPILRSRLQLRANLATESLAQPSYTDIFYLTLVHEFGHTLGLQHTMTSSVMSTSITRATKKGSPLAADDIAAISTLYPGSVHGITLASVTGRITGKVTQDGNGVNLASVVALSTNGTAISALTDLDGTYHIEGVPPGNYLVYAHPLPPAQTGEGTPANIITPLTEKGDTFPANTGIDTRFYPGTKDWTKAGQVTVAAGKATDKIDFAMAASSGPKIYNMETYGYRTEAMAAPPLKGEVKGNPIVFAAPGTTATGFLDVPMVAPGLTVNVIGNAAQIRSDSLRYYTNGFLLMYVDTAKVTSPTPVALAVTRDDELYILPAAFTVEPNAAPQITSLLQSTTEDGTALATITGAGLTPGATQILFDAAPANLLAVNEDGSWVLAPPVAPSALTSTVEAVNPDGQTSILGLPLATRTRYTYAQRDEASFTLSAASLVAGADAMIVISGTNTHFSEGHTVVGFGTSDVTVRSAWVLSPTVIALNVAVGPEVGRGPVTVTVVTDLEILTNTQDLQAVDSDPQQINLIVPATNAVTGLAGIPAGGTALLRTSGLPQDAAAWNVTVGGIATTFTLDAAGVLAIRLPDKLPVGPAVVQLTRPDGTGPQAILLQVDAPAPVITSAFDNTVLDGKGAAVAASSPARVGDSISLFVAQLNPAGEVWIRVAGATLWPAAVGAPDKNGISLVTFTLPATLPYDAKATQQSVPVQVGTGTRLSDSFTLLTHVDPPKAN